VRAAPAHSHPRSSATRRASPPLRASRFCITEDRWKRTVPAAERWRALPSSAVVAVLPGGGEHLVLAGRERADALALRRCRKPGIDDPLARGGATDRGGQLGRGRILEQEACHAFLHCPAKVAGVAEGGQDQDLVLVERAAQILRGVETGAAGHLDVQRRDVRSVGEGDVDDLVAAWEPARRPQGRPDSGRVAEAPGCAGTVSTGAAEAPTADARTGTATNSMDRLPSAARLGACRRGLGPVRRDSRSRAPGIVPALPPTPLSTISALASSRPAWTRTPHRVA